MSREELKWHQLAHNQLISPQGPHFGPHSIAKTNDKSTNLMKNGFYWSSEEVDDDNDYELIARNDGFSRAPEIDFRYETKARKVMVDFKFDALYRYVSIESLLKSGE